VDSYTQYVYDAGGTRVAKGASASLTCGAPGSNFSLTNQYLVGLGGEQVTELDGWGDWLHTDVWAGGRLLATYDGFGIHFPLTDPLGTKRIQANAYGAVDETCFSLPYGDGLNCIGDDATEHHFTGKERDTESGNDYFGARYYASSMGRFMSPDPINLTNARLLNPANTLNKYAYGANNPLKYIDKDGKDITIFFEAPAGKDVGHIFLAAVNQGEGKNNGQSAMLSFGPKGGGQGFGLVSGPGQFKFPVDLRDSSSYTIRTNPEDTQKVIDAINKLNSGSAPDFELFMRNCTTEVQDVLKDLGLDFGDISPTGFWNDVYFNHDNPFHANAPHQPGQDYGNPRNYNGKNYRDVLFNMFTEEIRQPKACVTAGGETTCDQ
jgi:RHS repeat-associated protein